MICYHRSNAQTSAQHAPLFARKLSLDHRPVFSPLHLLILVYLCYLAEYLATHGYRLGREEEEGRVEKADASERCVEVEHRISTDGVEQTQFEFSHIH